MVIPGPSEGRSPEPIHTGLWFRNAGAMSLHNREHLWLWVPAFAGTTQMRDAKVNHISPTPIDILESLLRERYSVRIAPLARTMPGQARTEFSTRQTSSRESRRSSLPPKLRITANLGLARRRSRRGPLPLLRRSGCVPVPQRIATSFR